MATVTPDQLLETKAFFRSTIKDVREKLNPLLINNPKFDELLYNELFFFVRKIGSTEMEVSVSDDKNSVSIVSHKPLLECSFPEFNGKNRAYMKTIIYLKDTNLVCEFNQGVLLNRKLLEENGFRAKLQYQSKLETYYSIKFFTENGIEYSNSSYSDVYPFDDICNDIDLRERTLSSFHKPTFNEYQLPVIPIHVLGAKIRNTYRKKDSLAVIHSNVATGTRDGYKDVHCALFTCHPSMPELLRGAKMFAKSVGNAVVGFRFDLVDDYASSIPEAYEKARKEFKEAIENCNLKEFNMNIYTALYNSI